MPVDMRAAALAYISVAAAVLLVVLVAVAVAVLVDVVLHGVLAVHRLRLVQLRLRGGDLGLAALVRQLSLVVRPRRRRLRLLRHLGLRDSCLRLHGARAVLHLLAGVIHLCIYLDLVGFYLFQNRKPKMMNPQSRVQEYMVEHIDLIPGMPDDVAVDCLARVPHGSFRSMRRVCRGWKSAAAAPDFALARAEAGANEDLVFLLQFGNPAAGNDSSMDGDAPENSPAYGVAVYNVTTGEWHSERAAPPMPMFAQCAAVGTRLAVMGGWDPKTFEPVADVHVLDAATGVWHKGAPMRSARSFFACAEAGGKIYVAGGHDKLKNALKTAEAYDAEADGWDPLPDMSEERDECDGMATVAGDRFLAVSGYRTGRQGGFERDAEWFDPATREWRRLERVRAPPSAAHVVVRGRVWCIEGTAVMEWRGERRGWIEVGPYPPGLKAGTARAVAVSGGERVVVTGAIESGGHAVWVFNVKSKSWTVVQPPPEFAGFVFSVASVRV